MRTTPSEGWGVVHLFYQFRPALLEDPVHAGGAFIQQIESFNDDTFQALPFSVLGLKADIGFMLIGPDLAQLDSFTIELHRSAIGTALAPAGSYVSLTETSEYTSTIDDERARLIETEELTDGPDLDARLAQYEERMAQYREDKLHPRLPKKSIIGFYPMSKRREGHANWYAEPFDVRKRLMAGHARVGRSYKGRVLQLVTGSTGLDDWEWGVTLLTDDLTALKEIVYDMRFDEVSAQYAEFGPFITGLMMDPETLLRHHGLDLQPR